MQITKSCFPERGFWWTTEKRETSSRTEGDVSGRGAVKAVGMGKEAAGWKRE